MSQNKSLIELTTDYNFLLKCIVESEGEISPDIERQVEITEDMLSLKIDKYDFLMKKLESEEAHWKERADAYAKVARTCNNVRAKMKDRIKEVMISLGKKEIIGETTTFKLTNSNPKLIINEKELPSDYVVETVIIEPNKDKIKDALKNGKSVTGAYLEEVLALRTSVSRKVK